MTDECYSLNEEDFSYSELQGAVEVAADNVKPGTIVSIWKGTPKRFKASDFAHFDPAELGERAYDDVGEHCGGWPHTTKEQDDELNKSFREIVDAWAIKHGLQPDFFGVENIEQLNVKILTDYDFEVIK